MILKPKRQVSLANQPTKAISRNELYNNSKQQSTDMTLLPQTKETSNMFMEDDISLSPDRLTRSFALQSNQIINPMKDDKRNILEKYLEDEISTKVQFGQKEIYSKFGINLADVRAD